jgi:uncharacterized protein (TIGR02996 family)
MKATPGRNADEDALLRAVWDAPHDDAPRLVYADWLEENGDAARAEFIRVQIELARFEWDDDRHRKLAQRRARLWQKNQTRFTQGLPSTALPFDRGFPSAGPLTVNVADLERFDVDRYAFAPILEIGLEGDLSAVNRVVDWPGLDRVGTLQLRESRVDGPALARLLASPRLRHLTALELVQVEIGESGIKALVESPAWPRLTRLGSWNTVLARRHIELLAAADPPPGLDELALHSSTLGPAEARVLAASPLLAGLRVLDLSDSPIGSAGVTALADSPHLSRLGGLGLGDVGSISARAVERLAASPYLAGLQSLSIGVLSVPDSAAAFLKMPALRRLFVKRLSAARLSPAVSRKLRARFGDVCLRRAQPGSR